MLKHGRHAGQVLRTTCPTLALKQSRLGSNPDTAINCHSGVSHAGSFIIVGAIPRMDGKRASCLPELVGGR